MADIFFKRIFSHSVFPLCNILGKFNRLLNACRIENETLQILKKHSLGDGCYRGVKLEFYFHLNQTFTKMEINFQFVYNY